MLKLLSLAFALAVAVFSAQFVGKLIMNAPAMRALQGER